MNEWDVFYDRVDGEWLDNQVNRKKPLTAELKQLIGYLSFIMGQEEGMNVLTSTHINLLDEISRNGLYGDSEAKFMNTLRERYIKQLSKFYE